MSDHVAPQESVDEAVPTRAVQPRGRKPGLTMEFIRSRSAAAEPESESESEGEGREGVAHAEGAKPRHAAHAAKAKAPHAAKAKAPHAAKTETADKPRGKRSGPAKKS